MLTVKELLKASTYESYQSRAKTLSRLRVFSIASVIISGISYGIILSYRDSFRSDYSLNVSLASAKIPKLITEVYLYPAFLSMFLFFIERKRKVSPFTLLNKLISIWILVLFALYLFQSLLTVVQLMMQFINPITFWESTFYLVTLHCAHTLIFPLRDTLTCATIVYLYWHQCLLAEKVKRCQGRKPLLNS